MMDANYHSLFVIRIGSRGRYFCKFGKHNQVLTAWCLAGAKTLSLDELDKVRVALDKKGKKYNVCRLQVVQVEH